MAPMNATNSFNQASDKLNKKVTGTKSTSPISIRFTVKERAYLDTLAGDQPVSSYIREKILGEKAEKRKVLRKPRMEDIQYSTLLANLGQSRLSSNVNQLAKHANMGTLDCSQNIEQQLEDACGAILAMRDALFMALGHRPNVSGKSQ
jgi:hypothetical protein